MNRWTGLPPLGWEWKGEEEGPPHPTPEQRRRTVPEKNWAPRLQELGKELYHGTSRDAAEQIQMAGTLEPRAEWGLGHVGIFCWSDLESALNWANYWYGDDLEDWNSVGGGGTVIVIPPSVLQVVRRDLDPGNVEWKAWREPVSLFPMGAQTKRKKLNWNYSQAFVIENGVPASELNFLSEELFNEYLTDWEEQVDEWWSLRPPYPQFVDFVGDKGPGWAEVADEYI